MQVVAQINYPEPTYVFDVLHKSCPTSDMIPEKKKKNRKINSISQKKNGFVAREFFKARCHNIFNLVQIKAHRYIAYERSGFEEVLCMYTYIRMYLFVFVYVFIVCLCECIYGCLCVYINIHV